MCVWGGGGFSEERNSFGRKLKCFVNECKLSRENAIFLKQSFSSEHNSFARKRKCFANERNISQGNALLLQEKDNFSQ